VRLFFNLVLVVVTLLACYLESFYLSVLPPQVGEIAPLTIRSQRTFRFDQEKALGSYRKVALSRYVPLYTYAPDGVSEARKKIEAFSAMVSTLQNLNLTGGEELVEYTHREFDIELSRDSAAKLLHYPKLNEVLNGMLTIEESILLSKIVRDPEPIKGKESVEVSYPNPTGVIAYPAEEVITLAEAKLKLRQKAKSLFWQLDDRIMDSLVEISLATISPNLKYNQRENKKRIDKIIQQYPSRIVTYRPGDVLVPIRKVLSDQDMLILRAYLEEGRKDLFRTAPWILMLTLLMVVLYELFFVKIEWAGRRDEKADRLKVPLLIISIVILKGFQLLTPLPIYAAPFAVLPFLLLLLHDEKISVVSTTLMGALLITLFSGRTLNIFLFFAFGGVVAVLFSLKMRKRLHIIIPSLLVGIVNVVIITVLSVKWELVPGLVPNWQSIDASSLIAAFDNSFPHSAGLALLGGLIAGPVAILLLPLIELSFHVPSAFSLNRYADLQHPLMKDLLTRAPATYQHTMTVAYLAQAAGDVVGANTTLLRIGAYYHDIGKIENPEFFSENQLGADNPHDDLEPEKSAKLIIDHVKNGQALGRARGLPEIVVDLIAQHHGTQVVEFFYEKAVERKQEFEPRKEDFRYLGPKPQSLEAAILMIVDAVEAASRSIREPSLKKIETMIRLLIVKRLADGQLDECNLSTHDLAKIVETLVNSLMASGHSRIAYPWQKLDTKARLIKMQDKRNNPKASSGLDER
jgi:putative nucleotidyltransferase with HDIG domain